MQIDIIWLRDNFKKFNKQYFDSSLPEPRFFIGRSRTRLGSLAYERGLIWRHGLFGKGNSTNAFTLSISNFYNQSEYQFRNVLLHEMIHLSIAVSGIKDTSPHGVVFRGMMERLNHDGWNIQVMTNMNGVSKAYAGNENNAIRQYLVLTLETNDGKYYVSSVNPKFARNINKSITYAKKIKSHKWYTTNNKRFEDMPKVRSLRAHAVDAETYKQLTTLMTPITLN